MRMKKTQSILSDSARPLLEEFALLPPERAPDVHSLLCHQCSYFAQFLTWLGFRSSLIDFFVLILFMNDIFNVRISLSLLYNKRDNKRLTELT